MPGTKPGGSTGDGTENSTNGLGLDIVRNADRLSGKAALAGMAGLICSSVRRISVGTLGAKGGRVGDTGVDAGDGKGE